MSFKNGRASRPLAVGMVLALLTSTLVTPSALAVQHQKPEIRPALDGGHPNTLRHDANGTPGKVLRRAEDYQLVSLGGDLAVEKLRGEAALAHLYHLFSRRPQAFEVVRQSLKERGFSATQHVYVERTVRLAADGSPAKSHTPVPAQTYEESSSEGEIIFWSWDDGDDATWEGTIYWEVYANGAASTWDAQVDVSTEEYPWVYYTMTWEDPGSDGPISAGFDTPPPRPGGASGLALASAASRGIPISQRMLSSPGFGSAPGLGGMYALAGVSEEWALCYRMCVLEMCSAAAAFCLLSGPIWPECFAGWCIGMQLKCAIDCYYQVK